MIAASYLLYLAGSGEGVKGPHKLSKRSENATKGMMIFFMNNATCNDNYLTINEKYNSSTVSTLGTANTDVDCGGYRRETCNDCILHPNLSWLLWYLWCNGQCHWDWTNFKCTDGKFTH